MKVLFPRAVQILKRYLFKQLKKKSREISPCPKITEFEKCRLFYFSMRDVRMKVLLPRAVQAL